MVHGVHDGRGDTGHHDLAQAFHAKAVHKRVGLINELDLDGADVLILGCASMGGFRPEIEGALGLPVIDPTQAAVVRATGLLTLGYGRVG